MSRRPRRPILAAAALTLLLATSALWFRSLLYWDLGQYVPRDGWAYSLHLGSGVADLSSSAELSGIPSNWDTDPAPPGRSPLWAFRFSFESYPAWLVRIPLWSPALPAALLLIYAWPLRRPPHPTPGLCPRCNYDLRATPDQCPECGHSPAITPPDPHAGDPDEARP